MTRRAILPAAFGCMMAVATSAGCSDTQDLPTTKITTLGYGLDQNKDGEISDNERWHLVQNFTGSSFTTSTTETTPKLSTVVQHLVVTGAPGLADLDVIMTFRTHAQQIAVSQPPCGGAYPYAAELLRLVFVQTYANGAAFSGGFATRELNDQSGNREAVDMARVCSDGTNFKMIARGRILGGEGAAFEDVRGGRWQVRGSTKKGITTGELRVKFNYAP